MGPIDQTDVDNLIICGRSAKWWRWSRVYYAVKDAILIKYGSFDGYDLQRWLDKGYFECNCTNKIDTLAEHLHILKRYKLLDTYFHIPTSEYSYFNFEYQNGKRSENFYEYFKQVNGWLNGKKEYDMSIEGQAKAFRALKALLRKHIEIVNQYCFRILELADQ